LSYALHAPKQIEIDWSSPSEFNNYLAEAVVFLPGYDNMKSQLDVTANGVPVVALEYERQGNGSIVSLRYYVRKSEGTDKVTFKIRYRPSEAFNKDYSLTLTAYDNFRYDEPTISGS
jgi:hypothetical protein